MASQLRLDGFSAVEVRASPSAAEFARTLEKNVRLSRPLLQLRFGECVAGFPVADVWSLCCELLLQAQLVREAKLDHFVLDVEQVFDISYSGDLLYCIFSREHVFAVERETLAAALEYLVEEIFAATSCPRLMLIGATWGAAAIRTLPYSCRFSESVLT